MEALLELSSHNQCKKAEQKMVATQVVFLIALVFAIGTFAQQQTLRPSEFRVISETKGDQTIFVACTGPCQVTIYGYYDFQNYTKGLSTFIYCKKIF